ncbi:MAG TPA: adenylate/guanylate cyclase domain-containing protein [Dongiaceae bacterium]|nr:adenylate/guanylate cyclase domain-containing protein [Dongiaceae bacterium]
MVGGPQRRTWIWRFDRPASEIWPALADTARFNEAAGLPNHEIEEIAQGDGSVLYLGRMRRGPFRLEWREKPVNWVFDRWFEHRREFRHGPLRTLTASFELAPDGEGCRGTYTLEAAAANPLGWLILATGFFHRTGRTFARLAATAGDFAAGARAAPFDYTPPAVTPATAGRVAALVAGIEATAHGHGLARRLADHVLGAQEVDLWHLRPLRLARDWGCPPRAAIELCLQAARAGLLDLRWDLLCPRCRVAKAWVASLDRLPAGAHCPSCNIDYDRDFSRNVEATFRPAPAVRPLAGGAYCLFGPMSTPHIKLHVTLDPGQSRAVGAELRHGPYRLRTLEPGAECDIEWTAGGFPAVIVDSDAVAAGPPGDPGTIGLVNRDRRPRTVIVEDRAWVADALTADRVTALQAFRDLFAAEVLRPGDEVGVGQVTLMFTDLKGSTALYERVGDAAAYRLVRDHFAFLAEQVRLQDGAIVKTIGDAVMAAFADPACALGAALAIQRKVAEFNAAHGDAAIVIKLGLHKGPCIAVTLNDRLDYFGTTVNMAARLQGESVGGDVVLSREVAADPGVAALLDPDAIEEGQASLKGFARPVAYYRLGGAAIGRTPAP